MATFGHRRAGAPGDNVSITVAQGEHARYRWGIDEDGPHHQGTDWDHPHIHGATAFQVLNGAAGAIIVEGPLDAVPSVAAARERVMMITEGNPIQIDGKMKPRLVMAPGQVERWRMIYAGTRTAATTTGTR